MDAVEFFQVQEALLEKNHLVWKESYVKDTEDWLNAMCCIWAYDKKWIHKLVKATNKRGPLLSGELPNWQDLSPTLPVVLSTEHSLTMGIILSLFSTPNITMPQLHATIHQQDWLSCILFTFQFKASI